MAWIKVNFNDCKFTKNNFKLLNYKDQQILLVF